MQVEDIDNALTEARQFTAPARTHFVGGVDVALSKCDLATACQAFLNALEPKAGFFGGIGIRMVHGKITQWKRANAC